MFVGSGAVLVATAAIGTLRSAPLFSLLTLLVAYQLFGAVRSVRYRQSGPARADVIATLVAMAIGWTLGPTLLGPRGRVPSIVILATLSAFLILVTYDLIRFLMPSSARQAAWRYEHVYKMVGSFAGMLSALAGNVFRSWQPWSQILPSVLGLGVIAWFFWRIASGRDSSQRPLET